VEGLIIQSNAGDNITKAVFEDDGNVAYCYIIENGEIASDVWVYNRREAPITNPWNDYSDPPYLNPEKYAIKANKLPESRSDVTIEWVNEPGKKPIALVKVFDEVLARISSDVKPGYARLAHTEGPLARPLGTK
jgi:hypothetical protein